MNINGEYLEAVVIAERNGILSKRKALRLVAAEIATRRQLEAIDAAKWFRADESSKK